MRHVLRQAFDEEIFVPPIVPRSSNLSPIPLRNPNIRFLEEDSPMKPSPLSPPQAHSTRFAPKATAPGEEDDIENEDLPANTSFHQSEEEVNAEEVDEFSEADFVGKSFDSIDIGDLSRSDLGEVALPSIFAVEEAERIRTRSFL